MGVPLGLLAVALAWRFLPVDQRHTPASSDLGIWALLKDSSLRTGLAMSALVAAVIMATFVVGPFYLSRGLGLDPASMGLAMAVGPCVAAITGIPAGRLTDRLGSQRMTCSGLGILLCGALLLTLASGLFTYLGALIVLTAGYSLFQAANNTAVMRNVAAIRRGTGLGSIEPVAQPRPDCRCLGTQRRIRLDCTRYNPRHPPITGESACTPPSPSRAA